MDAPPTKPFTNLLDDPRVQLSAFLSGLGVVIFIVGAHPDWLGVASTPEVGFLQVIFMVGGMGVFATAGIAVMRLLWQGRPWSVVASIGARIVGTGYVTLAAAVMADILGLGSQTWPSNAHFGPIQGYGMLVGEAEMLVGLLLMYPYRWFSDRGGNEDGKP